MVVLFHKDFIKNSNKLTSQQKNKLTQRLKLFSQDHSNPILNNHALRGRYQEHRSINITGDLRAIYKKDGENVTFVAIDSHSNLYG